MSLYYFFVKRRRTRAARPRAPVPSRSNEPGSGIADALFVMSVLTAICDAPPGVRPPCAAVENPKKANCVFAGKPSAERSNEFFESMPIALTKP